MAAMDRRALVLGGGGVTGIAWQTGLIAGLAGLGVDLALADVIIGTSAGSVVGTDIACGQEPEALYRTQLAPPAPEPAARIGWDFIGRLLWDVHTSRDPKQARARIGRWALAVPTMPEAGRRKVFEARLPASVWPSRALRVTAVDAQTGEFAVFDAAGDANLGARAVHQQRCEDVAARRSLAGGGGDLPDGEARRPGRVAAQQQREVEVLVPPQHAPGQAGRPAVKMMILSSPLRSLSGSTGRAAAMALS